MNTTCWFFNLCHDLLSINVLLSRLLSIVLPFYFLYLASRFTFPLSFRLLYDHFFEENFCVG